MKRLIITLCFTVFCGMLSAQDQEDPGRVVLNNDLDLVHVDGTELTPEDLDRLVAEGFNLEKYYLRKKRFKTARVVSWAVNVPLYIAGATLVTISPNPKEGRPATGLFTGLALMGVATLGVFISSGYRAIQAYKIEWKSFEPTEIAFGPVENGLGVTLRF